MTIGRLTVRFRRCDWNIGNPFRRDIYENEHEYGEYVYLGQYNLIFWWDKRVKHD